MMTESQLAAPLIMILNFGSVFSKINSKSEIKGPSSEFLFPMKPEVLVSDRERYSILHILCFFTK